MKNVNQAYRSIKSMIARYQLVPGQKIIYADLARKLRMSKTPVISALNRLEQEELVVSIPNRGYFVKEITAEEIAELFDIREALELLAVDGAIRSQTPRTLHAVEQALRRHRNHVSPDRYRAVLDGAFHIRIAQMGTNRSLVKVLRHLFELIYFRYRIEGVSPRRLQETPREHQAILDAIAERDAAKAKRLMQKHMSAGRTATMQAIRAVSRQYEL
jgi:DNA-binding GntR family transcriptional regulator